ncbi:P-loop NTPase family protein [Parasedimentitalea psychrophila]|uniref:Uncharacterized protein n=1 Tax=Parasedimentitalea psychrophila TaxID=2997337 RepID=A0A9Y2L0D8_9RHOB|nr:hypothetical protein [Parasedimentitalea psychrophila]WIY25853.1 hypothetical protein QPJ95_02660 [Parasedimentitalea psychrophila]
MTHPDPIQSPLFGQLQQALSQQGLPQEYFDWGQQLLQRLDKPVQVMVIGYPGSGKSTVIDMMLGQSVICRHAAAIPAHITAPIIEVCYGPEARIEIEAPDGRTSWHPGTLAQTALPPDTVRLRQELPGTRLQTHSFVEISLSGSAEQNHNILQRAARHADVILWCSEGFTPAEQSLWATVPDAKKDHSFLVLTMADRQIMRGTLTSLLAGLDGFAAEQFLGVYPLAAVQAITAQTADHTVNAQLWQSSGGRQLARDVQKQVELGRASDVDQAEMLVRQFAPKVADQQWQQTPPAPKPDPTPQNTPTDAFLHTALDLLQGRARQMLAETDGAANADAILSTCMDTVKDLSKTLLASQNRSPQVQAALDGAQDGEELLILFQLERGEDAAIDAVTLLLQLKREIADDISQ